MAKSKWSKELVIAVIQERPKNGLSIRASNVRDEYPELRRAAYKFFGGWKQAVEESGFRYGDIRAGLEWSREMVLDGIKRRNANGLALNNYALQVEDSNLLQAGERHFGSWGHALEAAGLNYTSIHKYSSRKKWSKESVIKSLQSRVEMGLKISISDVMKEDNPLASAGVKKFGSWEKAVEAAGYDYRKVTKIWLFKKRARHCVVSATPKDLDSSSKK